MASICRLARFGKEEDGSSSVEGMLITGVIIAMSLALTTTIGSATQDHSHHVSATIDDRGVPTF